MNITYEHNNTVSTFNTDSKIRAYDYIYKKNYFNNWLY